ncbi:MAG: 1-deoxy-D-xylulose-5-phosphate reductoisomerase [Pseudonocardia sp. SCN 72-86]|nr:MAG: 1-deoxy-D-xylulose-5-phosphate reductoisomerase [Pseudonocardia sp. SCN 72-86]
MLGSTGSVGAQAVDVIAAHPEQFEAVAICAAGNKMSALAAQAARLRASVVGVADSSGAIELSDRCKQTYPRHVPQPQIVAGRDVANDLATLDADVVLNAIDGARALRPTLTTLDRGGVVALANKEALIAGGSLITDRADLGQIVPVDSEHSALAQCLRGGSESEVARVILTASGGPFRGWTRNRLSDVTPSQALSHPTWSMGNVITTNSATLMNKGLELIEASLLFRIDLGRIDAVIHPESYIHSMVQFVDGALMAHASIPDMRLPISLALNWPHRLPGAVESVDWTAGHRWNFEPVDDTVFPAVGVARRAGTVGGCAPAVLNAANEHLVTAFHDRRVGFLDIVDTVAATLETWLDRHHTGRSPDSLAEVDAAQDWARSHAERLIRFRR